MALVECRRMLYYEEYGSGEVLVFLQGILASTKYWRDIIPYLAKNYRVIAIDQLGFGNSPKPDKDLEYTIDDNIRYYVEVFEHLNLKKVTLVCFSSSSIVAIRLASKYPDYVDKMMLIAPPIHFSRESVINGLKKSFKTYRYFLSTPLKSGFIIFISIFRKLLALMAPLFITHVKPHSARDIFKCTWKSLFNSIENIVMNQDVRSDLKNVRCKVKILYAKIDTIVNKDNLFQLSKEFPNIELEEIDSTHQIPVKNPQIVIDRISNLMREN